MKSYNALIFPAFVTDFLGCEDDVLRKYGIEIGDYFEASRNLAGDRILHFDPQDPACMEDELLVQYATYAYSCAVSDLVKKLDIPVHFVSAYSMGIYAALVHAGSLDYTAGLQCVKVAYESIRAHLTEGSFTMGLTGGLEKQDVDVLLKTVAPNTFIINSNNPHTFVYSGPSTEIDALILQAREEGALMTRNMGVSIPYHSPYLEKASATFCTILEHIRIDAPQVPIISSLSGAVLDTPESLREEMARNLHQPFQWYETMKTLLSKGVKTFYECGAGEGLYKINKFIPGEYRTVTLKRWGLH